MLIVRDREALARRKSSKLALVQQNQARSESFRVNFWQQQALLEETLAREVPLSEDRRFPGLVGPSDVRETATGA